jgi:hypothetical protein
VTIALTGGEVGPGPSDEAGAGSQASRPWRSLIRRGVTPAGPGEQPPSLGRPHSDFGLSAPSGSYFCCSALSVIDLEVASVLKSIWMIMLPFVVPLPFKPILLVLVEG